MKWGVAVGVVLGAIGVSLLWNGINSRFALQAPPDPVQQTKFIAKAEAATDQHPQPALEIENAVSTSNIITAEPASKLSRRSMPDVELVPAPYDKDRRYKDLLLEILKKEGWSSGEFERLENYLSDPRVEFRANVLQVNTSHKETGNQYIQYTAPPSLFRVMQFYSENKQMLSEAVGDINVPLEVVIAILRIESDFGRYPGKEYVFNVFWSLSLGDNQEIIDEVLKKDDPDYAEKLKKIKKRAKWGRKQLLDLIFMTHAGGRQDVMDIKGSWAGAFGLPQFIPTSYRAYGKDGDGDGIIDLDNIEDAAASIANYLKENGWRRNPDRAKQHKVVMRYNISTHYADAVLAIADSIRARTAAGGGADVSEGY